MTNNVFKEDPHIFNAVQSRVLQLVIEAKLNGFGNPVNYASEQIVGELRRAIQSQLDYQTDLIIGEQNEGR